MMSSSILDLKPHQRYAFLFSRQADKEAEDWNEHISLLVMQASCAHVDEDAAKDALRILEELATGRFAAERELYERVFIARKSAVSDLNVLSPSINCGADLDD